MLAVTTNPYVLERSFNVEAVNALANASSVRPFIGGDGESFLDLTDVLAADMNIALLGQFGGFVMNWCAPACYEIHTMILPEGRGPWAFQAGHDCIAMMRDVFGAKLLWTRVSPDLPHVALFARKCGMSDAGQINFNGQLFDILTWRAECL